MLGMWCYCADYHRQNPFPTPELQREVEHFVDFLLVNTTRQEGKRFLKSRTGRVGWLSSRTSILLWNYSEKRWNGGRTDIV